MRNNTFRGNTGLLGMTAFVKKPNEPAQGHSIYIYEIRMATPGDRMNTLNHEAGHVNAGPKPESADKDVWESQMQSTANRCHSHLGFQ